MYTITTTTTAAPVWVSTELQTIAASEPQSKRESRAVKVWATVKDHANRMGCTARRFGAASLLFLVRALFVAVGISSGMGVILCAALILPEITPNSVAAILLLRVPIMFAITGVWCLVWSWSLRHILPARLLYYIQYGNR